MHLLIHMYTNNNHIAIIQWVLRRMKEINDTSSYGHCTMNHLLSSRNYQLSHLKVGDGFEPMISEVGAECTIIGQITKVSYERALYPILLWGK